MSIHPSLKRYYVERCQSNMEKIIKVCFDCGQPNIEYAGGIYGHNCTGKRQPDLIFKENGDKLNQAEINIVKLEIEFRSVTWAEHAAMDIMSFKHFVDISASEMRFGRYELLEKLGYAKSTNTSTPTNIDNYRFTLTDKGYAYLAWYKN